MVVLSYSNSPFSSFECTGLQLKSSKSAMFFAVADKFFKPNQLGSIQCIKISNKKPFLPTLLHSIYGGRLIRRYFKTRSRSVTEVGHGLMGFNMRSCSVRHLGKSKNCSGQKTGLELISGLTNLEISAL
jgi:hypothetical protein